MSIIDEIRIGNIEYYGKGISEWATDYLTKLYKERTHLIYELIQNAEDACSKVKNALNEDFFIKFDLYNDRLEIRNNGVFFDEKDIKGISSIKKGTKVDDPSQIGKFGAGFKSVYAYTLSPKVYSGDYAIEIKELVLPFEIEKPKEIKNTLFIIPFNRNDNEVNKEIAYKEISEKLEKLDEVTLLFTNFLKRIDWVNHVNDKCGVYLKENKIDIHYCITTLCSEQTIKKEKIQNFSKWFTFKKTIENDIWNKYKINIPQRPVYIDVSFKFDDKNQAFEPISKSKLSVLFPTDVPLSYKFLINGPFHTTIARDNLLSEPWNTELFQITENFIPKIIDIYKENSFYNFSFINCLPLDNQRIISRFQLERLIPLSEKLYNKSEIAYFENYNTNLFTNEDLNTIFGQYIWIPLEVNKYPIVKSFFEKKLKIKVFSMQKIYDYEEKFNKFLDNKINDINWYISLYTFLNQDNEKSDKILFNLFKEKRIILINISEKGVACRKRVWAYPYDKNDKRTNTSQVFLPNEKFSQYKEFLPFVVDKIYHNPQGKRFLKELKIEEPEDIDIYLSYVLPNLKPISSLKEAINLLENLAEAYDTSTNTIKKDNLVQQLKKTQFLWCTNFGDKSKTSLKIPNEVYIAKEQSDLYIYFEGNQNFWYLSNDYSEIMTREINQFLNILGCKNTLRPDKDGRFEGLDFVLFSIDYKKSLQLWKYLLQNFQSKLNFTISELKFKPWVYDDKKNLYKPSEIIYSKINDNYEDKDTFKAKDIAEKLCFKDDPVQKILNALPVDERKKYQDFLKHYTELEKAIKKIEQRQIKENQTINNSTTYQDIKANYKKNLVRDNSNQEKQNENENSFLLTSEREEEIRNSYRKSIENRVMSSKTTTKEVIINTVSKEFDGNNAKEYLKNRYEGHCQICHHKIKTRSDFFIETYRIIEFKNEFGWVDFEFNVIALCPNCHAALKYNSMDLSNILEIGKRINKNDYSCETVKIEYNGKEIFKEYYKVMISVDNEPKTLHFHQEHMQKIAAFLDSDDIAKTI
jgi:hypothetical protein